MNNNVQLQGTVVGGLVSSVSVTNMYNKAKDNESRLDSLCRRLGRIEEALKGDSNDIGTAFLNESVGLVKQDNIRPSLTALHLAQGATLDTIETIMTSIEKELG